MRAALRKALSPIPGSTRRLKNDQSETGSACAVEIARGPWSSCRDAFRRTVGGGCARAGSRGPTRSTSRQQGGRTGRRRPGRRHWRGGRRGFRRAWGVGKNASGPRGGEEGKRKK